MMRIAGGPDGRARGGLRSCAAVIGAACACFWMTAAGVYALDWPMWGYDVGRTGRSPIELSSDLFLNWTRELPAPLRAWHAQHDDGDKLEFDLSYAPVVMGERVFVPSMRSDRITAYSVEDGSELWRYYADGPMRLAPAAWEGKVYCVSDDGHLYCLDAATGELRWKFNATPTRWRVLGNNRIVSMWPARGGPVIKDGVVYFAAGVWPMMGTFVYAVDAETGSEVWSNTGDGANWQRQPHGGAFSFAGLAPQGYIAATKEHLVVSGGRAPPAVLDRHTGRLLHLDIFGKAVGGYQVMADDEFFYHSGNQYNLLNGSRTGSARAPSVNAELLERARELLPEKDPKLEIYTVLAARDRLFAVTECGLLYCFGPDEREPIEHSCAQGSAARSADNDDHGVDAIIEESGARKGYALLLGVGDGALMEQLAARTDMHIVGIEQDRDKLEMLRRRFDDAGLYGDRIALICADPAEADYPQYISSLIIVQDPAAAGVTPEPASLERVFELLRPYNGKAFLRFAPDETASLQDSFKPDGGNVYAAAGHTVVSRAGPLPGAGEWTHQYADAANTAISHDERVRLPLGVLWFGSESHDNILPRHAAGPRPQVAGGRLLILGVETISARDVYTGREMWVREFPGIGHPFTNMKLERQWGEGRSVYMTNIPGAAYIGSPYVSLPDVVYLRYRGKIFALDPETGVTRAEFDLYPENKTDDATEWGHISVWEDLLITTRDPQQFDDKRLGDLQSWNATSSRKLVALDRMTGKTIWERPAGIGYRHNAIAAGAGRLFVIDGLSEQAMDFLIRRGQEPEEKARMIALDIRTGEVLWETEERVFGTYLAYNEEHDLLLESGSRDTRRSLPDEPSGAAARRAADGDIVWTGGLQFPAILRDDLLLPARAGGILNVLTGERVRNEHPITGDEYSWSYNKFYGCGTATGTRNLLFFRSGAAGYTDLAEDGGTGNFGGFRAGCTANLIAADGILNAPDYTRTCTCSYQNQTSLGLVHMPDADIWTSVWAGRGEGPVRRLGVNLGAPGNRRADNGTLWAPVPFAGPPAPTLEATMDSHGFSDVPVRLVSALSSSQRTPGSWVELTLNDDFSSCWSIRSNRSGNFGEWISFGLSEPVLLDSVEAAWLGPTGTQFRIETSLDGEDWTQVFGEEGRGPGRSAPHVYRFEPVEAQHVRLFFGDHADMREDRRGRRLMLNLNVSRVRIGDIAWPDAYSYFLDKDVFRVHPLFVDGMHGPNWVAASGIRDIKMLKLEDIGAEGGLYTVNLHFSEPDDVEKGERVFDVRIQGEKAAEEVDAAGMSGGRRRAFVKSFSNISVDDTLVVEFDKRTGSSHGPVLSGMEIIKE